MAEPASSVSAGGPERALYYRKVLTPLLHRRFVSAASSLILLSWLTSFFLNDWTSMIWFWFPFGPAGVRTLLLFICGITVFVGRVAHIHFGEQNLPSLWNGLKNHMSIPKVCYIVGVYPATALIFAGLYLQSVPLTADLGRVTQGRAYERARLNEKPIFLCTHLLLLAFYQVIFQIHQDWNRIRLPPVHPVTQDTAFKATTMPATPRQRIFDCVTGVARSATKRAGISFPFNFVLYALVFRHWAWLGTYYTSRILGPEISPSSEPDTLPPYHYKTLWHSLLAGVLLVVFWDLCSVVFDVYLAQPPIKAGIPLTNSCRIPNGNLLNGLGSRKELIRTFAFWELLIISQNFETRRKAIFEDLNRNGSSAWSQILGSSLKVLEDINTRIVDEKAPPPETTLLQGQNLTPPGLPRLSAPLKQGAVLSPSRSADWKERNASRARELAKSFGQTPDAGSPLKTLAMKARDRALTEEQQKALTYDHARLIAVQLVQYCLWTPYVGKLFQQTFASRSRAKVLGSPTSEKEIILRAIDSLACLTVASLKDDRYGIVHKDIPLIVRTFVNVTGAIEEFIRQSPVHWTDVEFEEEDKDARKVPEIEEVLEHLKAGLAFLLSSFAEYAADMGLGPIELREARKAAGLGVS